MAASGKDKDDENVEMWRVRNLIKALDAAHGNGTSMISLIIPPKDQISRVNKMLGDEYGTASNIKSRVNRLSVLGAITSTQHRLKLYDRVPRNGLVIYCGTVVTPEGKEKKVNIDLEPFRPINTSLYLCDNKFHTEALKELLESDEKFGFVVMDGSGSLFATLSGNTREILHKVSVDLPKKHGRGGQSAARFGRLRQEKRHNYVRKVAELAKQLFVTNDVVNVSGIILSGLAEFKNDLSQSDLLDERIKKKVIKIVDVSYGGENGLNQAIELSRECLANVKFLQEKELLQQYFEEIARDTGKYAYGIRDVMSCLEAGAVETLIVWEDIEMDFYLLRSPTTGETTERFLAASQAEREGAFADKKTKEQLEVAEQMGVVEYFANKYKTWGCILEFVSDRSTEGSQFCRGFGGIGALLRWKPSFLEVLDEFDSDEDGGYGM
jgi:peptide chain release factor subunit 1